MDLESLAYKSIEGEREAFGLLYKSTFQKMKRVVGAYVQDPDATNDILHDGYMLALTSIVSLRDPSKVEGWLVSIMRNLALQYIRESKTNPEVSIADDIDEAAGSSEEETLLTQEDLEELINALPEGYNRVFRLSVLDGLSHKEIALKLGIAPNSSSSQLHRAKVMLKKLIKSKNNRIDILVALTLAVGSLWTYWHRPHTDSKPELVANDANANTNTVDIPEDENTYRHNSELIAEEKKLISSMTTIQQPVSEKRLDSQNTDIAECLIEKQISESDSVSDVSNEKENYKTRDISKDDGNVNSLTDNEEYLWYASEIRTRRKSKNWMSMACSADIPVAALSSITRSRDIMSEIEVPDRKVSRTIFHAPISFGISVQKSILPGLSLESGLRYTRIRTDEHTTFTFSHKRLETRQTIHYVSVPAKISYRFAEFGNFSVYGHAGGTIDIPVRASDRKLMYTMPLMMPTRDEVTPIYPSVRWSVEGGVGLQYELLPHVGIYAEPTFNYHIPTGNNSRIILIDKPIEISIPAGIRFSW